MGDGQKYKHLTGLGEVKSSSFPDFVVSQLLNNRHVICVFPLHGMADFWNPVQNSRLGFPCVFGATYIKKPMDLSYLGVMVFVISEIPFLSSIHCFWLNTVVLSSQCAETSLYSN